MKKRMLIIELGHGGTLAEKCGKSIKTNSRRTAIEIIDKIAELDTGKYEIVFKLQLFTKESVPYLEPLKHGVFDFIYKYCEMKDYKCTASVFDYESLAFLKDYDTPFIKIAARPNLYSMIDDIKDPMVSVQSINEANNLIKKHRNKKIKFLYCIPKYPAKAEEYMSRFGDVKGRIGVGLSDHTEDLWLFKHNEPLYYERHVIKEHGMTKDEYGDSFCSVPSDFEGLI